MLLALPLVAVAAAVYYASHVADVVVPDVPSSRPAAMPQASSGIGAAEVDGSKAPEARPESMATNSADAMTELPDGVSTGNDPVQDEPTPAATAAAEPKPDSPAAVESSPQEPAAPAASPPASAMTKSGQDGQRSSPRDRNGPAPAPKSRAEALIATPTLVPPRQGVTPAFQPPAACSEAVAALGLCKRNNPDEGK